MPIRCPYRPLWLSLSLLLFLSALLLSGCSVSAHKAAVGSALQECEVDLPDDLEPCKVSGEPIELADARFAAYIRDGKQKIAFRDVGTFITWRDKQCTSAVMNLDQNIIVRDYETCEERAVFNAFFLVHSGIQTPHAQGIVAFKTREAAERYKAQTEGAEVFDYESLVEKDVKDICP